MTNLLKLAAVAMLLVSAQSANAISLRFKFKVFSSGPSIYACNAGIRTPTGPRVCYIQDTGKACTPNGCAADDVTCHTRCVCTSEGGGAYLMNYGAASVVDWTDNQGSTGTNGDAINLPHTPTTVFQDMGNNWKQLLVDNSNGSNASGTSSVKHDISWNKRIQELTFNLGSELYSAEYFVDICYRGPQIEYTGVNSNFTLNAQASATDFLSNSVNPGDSSRDGITPVGHNSPISYTKLSGLKVKSYVVCDRQEEGTYKYAHNGSTMNSGNYNTIDNEANIEQVTIKPNGSNSWATSNPSFLNGVNTVGLFNNLYITADQKKAPRFCKVRYIFTETNGLAGEAAQGANNTTGKVFNLRKWQRHGAEMCTWTEINESVPGTLN